MQPNNLITRLPALAAALAAAVLTTIPARGAPWTPADLPQPPALWLDASDLSASPVSAWNDKSGNSRNFAQATGANQPAYSATSFNTSYPGVTFDGSSDFMSAGDTLDMRTNSLTVMSVVRYATGTNPGVIIAKTRYAAGSGRWVLYRAMSGGGLGSGTQYNTVLQPDFLPGAILQVADSSTSARINGFVLDRSTSGSCKIWDNGTNTASATFTGNSTDFNNTDELWLGTYQNPSGTTPPTGGSYLNGVIAEVVVVQTAMSDTDRQKLEGYLAWKWGMQANLPVGHPYESAAPESSDTTPPTIATLNPTDDATGVLTYANLVATFDEFVQKGTGNITLKKSTDNSTVETFDVAASPRITVSGASLTIDPTGYLEGTTGYYVEIDATAVKDMANNFFAGIADTTTWNFTTGVADTTAPTIATLSPADNATGADEVANLVATFDENIQKGTGNITLKKSADNSTVETFDVATSPRITVSGATLTIDPTGTLVLATGYYVQIDPAAIQDLSGNSFAGIADSTTWNFTTTSSFTIPVLNPSFQSNVVGENGSFYFTSNWTIATYGPNWGQATWNPGGFFTDDVGNGTPLGADQSQIFTIYGGDPTSGGRIHQDTTTPLTANTTYTLTVAVGRRLDGNAANWGIDLMTTSQTLGSQYLARLTGTYTDLTTGRFVDKVVTFTPTAGHPNLGQNLRVHLWLQGIDGTHTSVGFDNVRLDAAVDTTPPAIATLNPASGASGVAGYANLAVTFDEAIASGTGAITIRKSADDSVVETFDVATSPRVAVSGATLIIDPTGVLPGLTGCYVQIDATAIKDRSNNHFAGIADTTTWRFTTAAPDTTAPALATFDSPPSGSTGVAGDAPLVLTFSEAILKGTGNIVIRRSDDGSVVDTIDVTSGNVNLNGAQVTITPNVLLPATGGLYVEIGAGAFEDLSGNPFAGISGAGAWSFSTQLQLAIAPNEPQSGFRLSWESWPGQTYNLSGSQDLNEWNRMLTRIPATPPVNSLEVNPAEARFFYQIESVPPLLGNASFEAPPANSGALSSTAPQGWAEFDPAGVGNVGTWNPPTSAHTAVPDGSNVACLHHAGSIPLQAYGLSRLLGAAFAVGTDYQVTVEVGRPGGYGWPGYRVELWAGATKLSEDDNTLHPVAGGFLTSTVTYLHDAADAGLAGQPLMIRLLSRGEDPDGAGPAADFRVTFDQVAFQTNAAATGVVASIQLVLPANPGAVVTNLADVFSRQIAQRCDATVVTGSGAAFVVELATAADAGAEGFRIENRAGGGVRIVGGDDRGLVAGVGKFLRTSRYDQGGFTPGTWRGASVPLKANRGIYFATHFHNYYHEAPVEEIARYVEDLALWGLNELVVWYDMHHFNGFEDPEAVKFRKRLHDIMAAAKQIGMDVSLVFPGNEAYGNSPAELRASGGGRGAVYPCAVCPSKPEGMKYILKVLGEEFDWAADLKPRSVWIWPYDAGGCGCAECKPWGSKGFMKCVREVGKLARKKLPGAEIFLSTWCLDNNEWQGIKGQLALEKKLVDGIISEPGEFGLPIKPEEHGLPMVGFPEISMHETFPWGGFGATPLTARSQGQWNAAKGISSGGFPYSEGLFEDLTKAVYSQFYWNDQPAAETVKEYIAFEFSPDVEGDVAGVIKTLEQNHHWRWWPGELEGVPLEMNWFPSYGAQPQADPGAEEAYATMQEVATRLTPQARTSWRWRQLYLRALLDSELKTNGGSPNTRCNRAFAELIQIYHAENAIGAVRPPLPKGWQPP